MKNFIATLEFEAPTENAAAQKITTGIYLADLEVDKITIKEVNADGSTFDYPFTRQLIEGLENKNGN